ncbi:hypothetical protein NM688_g1704 [Phlebia brevispora]|uniref:Uncharacterized protein n=1 Tax=Phlebia brevispora TaxID=194682 RepID=A0ACC1TB19_9APHY|nr:hypothetical protein NM688_g1704 [Phlebia brevispora]
MTGRANRKRPADDTSDEIPNKRARHTDDDGDQTREEINADEGEIPHSGKKLTADQERSATADASGEYDEKPIELETKVSTATRSYFSDAVCVRFNAVNSHLNLRSGCATLSTVPIDRLGWGPVGYGHNDRSHIMFLNDGPLSLWVFFRRKQGMKFKPLVEKDDQVLHTIWSQLSSGGSDNPPEFFWANRWVGSRDDDDNAINAMDGVYDGRHRFRGNKSQMDEFFACDLKPGDVVLLEMTVRRYIPTEKPKEPQGEGSAPVKRPYTDKRIWRRWDIEFVLDCMSILFQGSKHASGPARPTEDIDI